MRSKINLLQINEFLKRKIKILPIIDAPLVVLTPLSLKKHFLNHKTGNQHPLQYFVQYLLRKINRY